MQKKNIFRSLTIVVLVTLIIGLGFTPLAAEDNREHFSLDNLENIISLIENYHVEEYETEELLEAAIEGMLREIDVYSSFMSQEEYQEMQEEFEGEFGGIGIQITTRDDKLTIVAPISNTPGAEAGLQAEDVITKIDGVETKDISQERAVDKMRGEPGTDVTLTIERGEEEPFDVEITRDLIEVPIAETEIYEDGRVGYLSISQFLQQTGDKTEEALLELEAEGVEALILDLRNNPGGILDEAADVGSLFASEGTIVSIKQRGGQEQSYVVSEDRHTTDLPVLVLTNTGSASGSEIVAGFIRDTERGKLLGTSTFGKGSVQSIFPLEQGAALRLTTANFYTAGENLIEEEGIMPDYELPLDPDTEFDLDNQLEKAIEAVLYYLEEGEWPETDYLLPDAEELERLEELDPFYEIDEELEEELEELEE